MIDTEYRPLAQAPRRQRGFTLIELMIALLIGLFLLGGLMTLVQDNRRSFSTQNQLSQLQDGGMFVSMMAITVDDEELQLLSQEITNERVASIDDALALIKKGVTSTIVRS